MARFICECENAGACGQVLVLTDKEYDRLAASGPVVSEACAQAWWEKRRRKIRAAA